MSRKGEAESGIGGAVFVNYHGVVRIADRFEMVRGRLHEAAGDAADAFATIMAAQLPGPVIWIAPARGVGSLAPTGLQKFIDPARFVLVAGTTRVEILWAAEEALRRPGASCVIFELDGGPDLRESRRLQIAAERGGGLGLALISGQPQASAAQTRWLCEASEDGSWLWHLVKDKGGKTGAWRVDYRENEHGPGALHLAAATPA